MANEVELKFSVDSKYIPQFRRYMSTLNQAEKPTYRKLTTIYYDTPDLQFLNAGICLRVRRISGHWVQSIKSTGSAIAGLHQRMEWEEYIATDQPDFNKISDPNLAKLFSITEIRNRIKPIFKTVILRRAYQITFESGDCVELAIDRGSIIVNDLQEPISEIELELKSGRPGKLFDLALQIQKAIPITLDNHSKAERGYNHYVTNLPKVQFAQPIILNAQLNSFEAFKLIAWECIDHLQGNQNIVLQQNDVEGVHQMRVAIRRLRSAFSVFKGILDNKHRKLILTELKWLANILGKARDLDVLILETLPNITTYSTHEDSMTSVYDLARTLQTEAYTEIHTALTSQRYQCLILTLSAWLENTHWQQKSHKSKYAKITKLATDTLEKHYAQLIQNDRQFALMRPNDRHIVRIYAKKLRYSTEFFSGLFNQKSSTRFIPHLSKLQDVLGALNDINNTELHVRGLVKNLDEQTMTEAIKIIELWSVTNTKRQLKKILKVWKAFTNQKAFWR